MGYAWTGGGRVAHGLGVGGLCMDRGWEGCTRTGGRWAVHGPGVGGLHMDWG